MSKKLVQKNIRLSFEFDRYVFSHPKVLKTLPPRHTIILTSANDKKLSEANRVVARSSRTGRFVEAHKTGKSWRIQSVKKIALSI